MVKIQQGNYGRGRGNYTSQGKGRGTQGFNIGGRGRERNNDKYTRFYDYCNTLGHLRETCFQLNGYPDWYQQLKSQKESANAVKPDIRKTPFDVSEEANSKQGSFSNILQGLQQELDKIKGKIQSDSHTINLVHTNNLTGSTRGITDLEFVGMHTYFKTPVIILNSTLNAPENIKPTSWVVDIRATTHMYVNIDYFTRLNETFHLIIAPKELLKLEMST